MIIRIPAHSKTGQIRPVFDNGTFRQPDTNGPLEYVLELSSIRMLTVHILMLKKSQSKDISLVNITPNINWFNSILSRAFNGIITHSKESPNKKVWIMINEKWIDPLTVGCALFRFFNFFCIVEKLTNFSG